MEDPRFRDLRLIERLTVGESLASGPGYAWLSREEREAFRVGVATHLGQDASLFLPVPRNSMVKEGGYLHGLVDPGEVLDFDREIQGALLKTREDFDRLSRSAPIAFPASVMRSALVRCSPEWQRESAVAASTMRADQHRTLTAPTREEQADQMQVYRRIFSTALQVPAEELGLFLGAQEALKAVLRVLTGEGEKPLSIALPLPNYSHFIGGAQAFGAQLYERSDETKRDVLYLSLSNNPLGYSVGSPDMADLLDFLTSVKEDTIVLDLASLELDREAHRRFFSRLSEFRDALNGIKKRIILVDSLSKKLMSAESRVGFLLTNDADLREQLMGMEPPMLSWNTFSEIEPRIQRVPRLVLNHSSAFLGRLDRIVRANSDALTAFPSNSNFCSVGFSVPGGVDRFLTTLGQTDVQRFGIARIAGLPLRGSGLFPAEGKALPSQGEGIIGLPENFVRLCTLSHPFVLDVLERSL